MNALVVTEAEGLKAKFRACRVERSWLNKAEKTKARLNKARPSKGKHSRANESGVYYLWSEQIDMFENDIFIYIYIY